jgi:hypothetical protein
MNRNRCSFSPEYAHDQHHRPTQGFELLSELAVKPAQAQLHSSQTYSDSVCTLERDALSVAQLPKCETVCLARILLYILLI